MSAEAFQKIIAGLEEALAIAKASGSSGWNYGMEAAPHGVKIIALGSVGTVTLSRWMPKENRWEMFTKDCPPIAWQPWPTAPEVPS